MRLSGIALLAIVALQAWALPARGFVLHPAVTVRAASVSFYSGHLVVDATGRATLDDGILHVFADRILLDLTNDRYVAAGDVVVVGATETRGVALGVDLASHRGSLIALAPSPETYSISGPAVVVAPAPSGDPPASEPLALPDLAGEMPFASAAFVVAHIGADVRLGSARVLVPGGKDVFLPSYVYTFSSNEGYSQSNVAGSGEEVPIYFGSTRDSIDGAHFIYSATTKVGLGFDHRIVDGDKAYDLFSVSPVNGPDKNADFTWEERINAHASQKLAAGSSSGSGSAWSYDLSDGVHRSSFDLSGDAVRSSNAATLSWQGYYEPLGSGWIGQLLSYHLRSEYGRQEAYTSVPATLFHTALSAGLVTPPLAMNESTTLQLFATATRSFDNSPHRQFAVDYGAQLQHRWNDLVTTSLSDDEIPTVDDYPDLGFGTRTYVSRQFAQLSYNHGEALGFTLGLQHQAGASAPPVGPFVQPWSASLDVRFRVSQSLSLDLSRSYGFGFDGQRFSSFGFQIFP